MPSHTVSQGECLHSIAERYGFFWETLWNHPENSQLKREREDPSVLLPGDGVYIPDRQLGSESRACEARHVFRKRGTPALVRIQILHNDEPRANEAYRLQVDGELTTGMTDGQGMVEMVIPPGAVRGEIHIGEDPCVEIYPFRLGTVDPEDTESGARSRLRNLGYDDSLPIEELLGEFQEKEELEASGRLDAATQAKLKERFGE